MSAIQHVCLVFAMRDEARQLINALTLKDKGSLNPPLPMRFYQGQWQELQLSLVLSGIDERHQVDNVGTEPAAVMAQQALEKLQPDLIISAGTAGGFGSKGGVVGQIILSQGNFVYHDHHVSLPGLDACALGNYPCLDASTMAQALGLITGPISSGSSLTKKPGDIEVIEGNQAYAKEMEAAAVAWVAMLYNCPMLAVKAITNLVDVDNDSEAEFMINFDTACHNLSKTLIKILSYLSGKSISELGRGSGS